MMETREEREGSEVQGAPGRKRFVNGLRLDPQFKPIDHNTESLANKVLI